MTKRSSSTSFSKQAAILIGCLFVLGCENDEETLKAEMASSKVMVEEARNVVTYFSIGGNMRAKLTAPFMQRFQADSIYVEFPKKLHVNFFDSTGRVESQLDARYGKYFETHNKVLLRDSVIVFNITGDTLRTPELWWNQSTGKFYTDSLVRIHKKGDRIYGGRGMEAKQDLTDIFIKYPTGTVTVEDELSPAP